MIKMKNSRILNKIMSYSYIMRNSIDSRSNEMLNVYSWSRFGIYSRYNCRNSNLKYAQ